VPFTNPPWFSGEFTPVIFEPFVLVTPLTVDQ
jgi:hypothetical protein